MDNSALENLPISRPDFRKKPQRYLARARPACLQRGLYVLPLFSFLFFLTVSSKTS